MTRRAQRLERVARFGRSLASLTADLERRDRIARLVRAAFVMFGVFVFGTSGYLYLSHGTHTWLQCLYMTVITVSTVGYTEVIATTSDALMVFNMVLIVFGGGAILYFVGATTALLLEGDLVHTLFRQRLTTTLRRQRRHVVVCGLGRMGRATAADLWRAGLSVVVIDRDEHALGELVAEIGEPLPFVMGDAFDHDALHEAGVERAAGLIAAMSEDRDNLYLTVLARGLNTTLRIVARASCQEASEKLRIAGADAVVITPNIAAHRLVHDLVSPDVTAFNDTVFGSGGRGLSVDVVHLAHDAPAIRKTLGEVVHGRLIAALGLREPNANLYRYRPLPQTRLAAGMSIAVLGTPRGLKELPRLLTTSVPVTLEPALEPLRLDGTVIVAGGGTVGDAVATELVALGAPDVVIIEQDASLCEGLRRHHLHRVRVICDDAFDEAVLRASGMEEAIALVAALPSARDNAFLCVSARRVNPDIRIASRADTDAEGSRLRRVGADAVVSVSNAGGRRLADAMATPDLVSLADALVRHGAPELLLREAGVVAHSRADGRRLEELRVTELTGAVVLAVRPKPGKPYVLRPAPSTRLDSRATILAIGDREALQRLDELVIP